MKRFNPWFPKSGLLILVSCLILFSCNNSFNVINRKYRPGYSFSSNRFKANIKEIFEVPCNELKTGVVIDEEEEPVFSCSNNKELLLYTPKSKVIAFVCDTPPKKSVEEPWSLYKPKEPKTPDTRGKRLEPFNLLSVFAMILAIALGGVSGAWALVFLLFVVTFNIISLIRIKRNPGKFKRLSKILATTLLIFLAVGILVTISLIVGSVL